MSGRADSISTLSRSSIVDPAGVAVILRVELLSFGTVRLMLLIPVQTLFSMVAIVVLIAVTRRRRRAGAQAHNCSSWVREDD